MLFADIMGILIGSGVIVALIIIGFFLGLALLLKFVGDDSAESEKLKQRLTDLFGKDIKELPIVTRSFFRFELPSVQLAVNKYCDQLGIPSETIGFSGTSLKEVPTGDAEITTLRYQDVDVDVNERMQCTENGLYIIDAPTQKLAILFIYSSYPPEVRIEVMALCPEDAAQCIDDLRELVKCSQVYRGKVISFTANNTYGDESGWAEFQIHRLPMIRREQIVLPIEVMNLIERNVIRFFEHADVLRRSGLSVKRGLLLHGPPGCGKSWTSQWLAQSLQNVTVFLLSGDQLWHIQECCRMARLLAPSLVIMEDVDLIATKREESFSTTALHQLLNEMDGLASESEVIFLLTTNRPEVIEPALISRPGRVDQAIAFPLPDEDCRRRLFELYGTGLSLDIEDLSRFIQKTESTSPAFIKELLRKAALIAAEKHSFNDEKICVKDLHLDEALRELMLSESELTRRLLGFSPPKNS